MPHLARCAHRLLPRPRVLTALARSTNAPSALSPTPVQLDSRRWVIVNVRNGLGNRLRAFASAASVAAALGRPLMVVWVSDPHDTCTRVRTRTCTAYASHMPYTYAHAPGERPALQLLVPQPI